MQCIYIIFLANSFATNNLKTATLVFALKNKKKKYIFALTKSVSIITELINKNLYLLLDNKSFIKI